MPRNTLGKLFSASIGRCKLPPELQYVMDIAGGRVVGLPVPSQSQRIRCPVYASLRLGRCTPFPFRKNCIESELGGPRGASEPDCARAPPNM